MAEVVQGMQSLLDSMDALPYTLQKTLIVRALRPAGQLIADEAGRIAPRSDEAPHMADDIIVVISEQTYQGSIARIGPSRKSFYAMYTELGTRFIRAIGWLRRAFDTKKEAAVALIGKILGEGIEKELKK